MIEYLIGVDGGGSGTRVRLAHAGGAELAQARGGPSGLALGIPKAWAAIDAAIGSAFTDAGLARPANAHVAIGLGLAGVHNSQWATEFTSANPGYAQLRLATDSVTTLIGAHQGRPGAIVAIGTGSVGQVLRTDGSMHEVGGWGFPAGDEASGAWMGLRAIGHIEKVMDGRKPSSPFARAVIAHCGGERDRVQAWLAGANQTVYATLAPFILDFAASDSTARAILADAGTEVADMVGALDPGGLLPLALCGGLGEPLRAYLPPALVARCVAPAGDAASGALRMIELHVKERG